jgi:hypothetical protein
MTVGYDVYITRKESWFEEEGPAIDQEEWLTLVKQDPELRLEPAEGPYHAVWNGPSEDPDLEPWLDWWEGNIFTTSPDAPLIDKMVELARSLGAKVQGDDLKIYTGESRNGRLPPPDA